MGLQWPSPIEAEKLVITGFAALEKAPREKAYIMGALKKLGAKYHEEHAQQARDAVLRQISKATDPYELHVTSRGAPTHYR